MKRILGFGDSLTAGSPGYEPAYGWGDVRSQYGYWLVESAKQQGITEIDFDNKGVPGELAKWMYNRLNEIFSKNTYDMVVILGGTNDLGWEHEAESVFQTVRGLWDLALEQGSKVVACTIPPIGFEFVPLQNA